MLAAALLCGGFAAACDASHSALATTFGGIAVATLVLPPLTLACDTFIHRTLLAVVSVSAIASVWLFLPVSWPQWGQCTLVLCAYVIALAGSVRLLHRLGTNAFVASAMVVAVALGWLSWPIWLSPYLAGHQTLVNWLVFAHPLLTLNGVLIDQGIWTERPHMYAWTALNQDVSYSSPANIGWCMSLHALLGLACTAVSTFSQSRKRDHESTRMEHESPRI